MKNNLTKPEIDALLPHINRVLETGKPWEDETLHHPTGAIIQAVLTIEGMAKKETEDGEGFDTNGWQYDWWQHFAYGDKEYVLSGSGYHGGHAFAVSDGY